MCVFGFLKKSIRCIFISSSAFPNQTRDMRCHSVREASCINPLTGKKFPFCLLLENPSEINLQLPLSSLLCPSHCTSPRLPSCFFFFFFIPCLCLNFVSHPPFIITFSFPPLDPFALLTFRRCPLVTSSPTSSSSSHVSESIGFSARNS